MMNSGNYTESRCFAFLLFLFLLATAGSRAQNIPAPAQHPASDVVMVSLEALNPRVEHSQHVRNGLVGHSDPAPNVEKRLLEIQMNIVRETAKFGPVLLLAPDESTQTAIYQQ